MKSVFAAAAAASFVIGSTFAGFSTPAFAKCQKASPLFGIKVYVDDKYCEKKMKPKKVHRAMKARSKPVKHRVAAKAPAMARKLPPADPAVRELQTLLTKAGYNPGPADGISGPATEKAVGDFMATSGLPSSTSRQNMLILLRRMASR